MNHSAGSRVPDVLRVGTRGSSLALKQTDDVIGELAAASPLIRFERAVMRTKGDEDGDTPIAELGSPGVFAKELEHALLGGEIDLAVHSLKDLPTARVLGLEVFIVLPRADARDAFVAATSRRLMELPAGAIIGTGSLRRRSQLACLDGNWRFEDIRGNLETRLKKLDAGLYDALVLAAAGLDRLGLDSRITERLPYTTMLPAPGQGALAVEIRCADSFARGVTQKIEDPATRAAVLAERALLQAVEGGCQAPLGAYATVVGDSLLLEGVLVSPDGRHWVRAKKAGPVTSPRSLGFSLGEELLTKGGDAIMASLRPRKEGS